MDNGNVAPISAFLAKKWVKVVLVLDVILIVGLVIFGVAQAGRNAIIDFEVTPLNAKISLNGKGGYENGEYKVFPGEYQVRIEHEGLEPKELSVNVGANDYVTVATFLKGEDGFSYYELMENYSDYESLEGMAAKGNNRTYDGDTSAEGFIEDFERAYKIFEEDFVGEAMPYEDGTGDWSVWSGEGVDKCEKTLCLYIVDLPDNQKDTLKGMVEGKGYRLEDYQIIYKTNDYRSIYE